MEDYLLYFVPFLCRAGVVKEVSGWWRVPISMSPFTLFLLVPLLPRFVVGEEREHILRHAAFAIVFTISLATSFRWDFITESTLAEWFLPLLSYCIVGCASLWWFVAAHVIENAVDENIKTHQGDVAALPLTLVAIATFVNSVPEKAFQFSRGAPFLVLIVVAWATLHFIAYTGFATRRVTTFRDELYYPASLSATVVAVGQLSLIETRASPFFYILFAFVASFLSQTATLRKKKMRPSRWAGTLVCAAGVGSLAVGLPLSSRFDPSVTYVSGTVGTLLCTLVFPKLAKRRWCFPSSFYLTLITCSVLAGKEDSPPVDFPSAVAVLSSFFASCKGMDILLSPSLWQEYPLNDGRGDPPSSSLSMYLFAVRLMNSVPFLLFSKGEVGDGGPEKLLSLCPPSEDCPPDFEGVWYLDGVSPLPLRLICIQGSQWEEKGGVYSTTISNWRCTARDSTLSGFVFLMSSFLGRTHITTVDEVWVRTDVYYIPFLRLLPRTYWIKRTEDQDCLQRIVFDSKGNVTWKYTLRRVLRERGKARTRHYSSFLSDCKGVRCTFFA